ncbi:MAG: hypothetical protein JWN71_3737 [Xanthobacteraceae bacterium]|nr:hypothetical protein [Xanthobacteraceae bacterium]
MRRIAAVLLACAGVLASVLANMTVVFAADRVALVIGNGAYMSATKLANPANDAADIAKVLRDIGFDVVEGVDVDRRTMEVKVREFSRKLSDAKVALFFYAGHGMQVAGKNYLVPVDAKLEQAGDLALDTVDVHVVLQQMESQKRINLVFLDACRDNPLARSLAKSFGSSRSGAVGQGLASIQSAIGTMIAFATQPDNVALDGSGRNSPFTTALLKHIRTPGLDISVMMRRVRTDVLAATGERQVPWDHSSLTDAVTLVPGDVASAVATPIVASPAPAAAPAAVVAAVAPPAAAPVATPRVVQPAAVSPAPVDSGQTPPTVAYTIPNATPATVATHKIYINELAMAADGKMLAVGDRDAIVLRELNGKEIRRLVGHDNAMSIAFSPDGRHLASGGGDRLIRIWDVSTGQVIETFDGHRSEVAALAFSPDGQQLASAGGGDLKIWDWQGGKTLVTHDVRGQLFQSVVWSPDGKQVVTGDNSYKVTIWDAKSLQVVKNFEGHRALIRAVAFTKDGRKLATGAYDKLVKLWDVQTGQVLRTFGAHSDAIETLAFSPDGRILATAGRDKVIRLWNVEAGRPGPILEAHTDRVRGLAFTPDGKSLASVSSDRTVILWSFEEAGMAAK